MHVYFPFIALLILNTYSFPIIKRRIAWLLGKWVHTECAQPNDEVWSILVYLLSDRGPGSDPVVRFTAASALRECVDVRKLYYFLKLLTLLSVYLFVVT